MNTYQKTMYVLTHTGRVLCITAADVHLINLGTQTYIPHHLNIKTRCLKSFMLKALHSPISLATVHFSQRTFPLSYEDNKW